MEGHPKLGQRSPPARAVSGPCCDRPRGGTQGRCLPEQELLGDARHPAEVEGPHFPVQGLSAGRPAGFRAHNSIPALLGAGIWGNHGKPPQKIPNQHTSSVEAPSESVGLRSCYPGTLWAEPPAREEARKCRKTPSRPGRPSSPPAAAATAAGACVTRRKYHTYLEGVSYLSVVYRAFRQAKTEASE